MSPPNFVDASRKAVRAVVACLIFRVEVTFVGASGMGGPGPFGHQLSTYLAVFGLCVLLLNLVGGPLLLLRTAPIISRYLQK